MTLLKALLISIIAVFAPIQPMIATAGALIATDLLLGLAAARKRKEKITSGQLRRTISKSVVYLVALCSGFLCETYLAGSLVPISKIIAGMIGMVELTSILENADELNGSPIFASLIKRLGSKNEDA